MPDVRRDLLEDRGGEYPAHIRIRNFEYDGTALAASLWLGNENQEREVDVLLTDADVEWLIDTLRSVLDQHRAP